MHNEVVAFLDTNILLHYRPIDEIDWCKELKATSVRLVICLHVIDELDEKKTHQVLHRRAKRAISDIEILMGKSQVRNNVTLEIPTEVTGSHPEELGAPCADQDGRIIASVLHYNRPRGVSAFLVTDDLGMRIRARAKQVSVHALSEVFKLEDPKTEDQKEIERLRRELLAIESRRPDFMVHVDEPNGESDCVTESPTFLVRRHSPTFTDEEVFQEAKVSCDTEFHFDSNGIPVGYTMEEVNIFLKLASEYFSALQEYCLSRHIAEANRQRQFLFYVCIENSGTATARNVDCHMKFPDRLAYLVAGGEDNEFTEEPAKPHPPERPTPLKYRHFPFSQLDRPLKPIFLPPARSGLSSIEFPARTDDAAWIDISRGSGGGFVLRLHVDEMKSTYNYTFGPFAASFCSDDSIGSFQVDATLDAEELLSDLCLVLNIKVAVDPD